MHDRERASTTSTLQPSASELRRDILFAPARVTTGWRVQRAAVGWSGRSGKAEGVGARDPQDDAAPACASLNLHIGLLRDRLPFRELGRDEGGEFFRRSRAGDGTELGERLPGC